MQSKDDRALVPQVQVQAEPPAIPRYYYHYSEPEPESAWRSFWNVLVKRRWWVVLFCLALTGITTLVCFLMTPIYKSSTQIQIVKDNPGAFMGNTNPISALSGDNFDSQFYETQFNVLKSREIAAKIINNLHLDKLPEFQSLKERNFLERLFGLEEKTPLEVETEMIDYFQDKLVIDPVKNTYLVNIAYKSYDKTMSKKVADAMVSEFNRFNMETRGKSFSMVKEWLEAELRKLAVRVDESQQKLINYGQSTNIYPPDDKDNVIVAKFVELNSLLTKAQSEAMAKRAQFTQIQEKGVNAPLIINNPLVLNLRQELVTQEAKTNSMRKIYGADHPEMQSQYGRTQELRGRLNAEIDRIRTGIKADYEAAVRSEELLREAFDHQKKQVSKFQNDSIQYKILKRDMDSYDSLYQGLLTRMKDASIAATMVSTNVSVIESGNLPIKPWLPKKTLFISMAIAIGLVGGVGLAFLREYFDNSIKSMQEMEVVCDLPSLGMVPRLRVNGSRKDKTGLTHPGAADDVALSAYAHPKSLVSEAIHQVRTSLMLSHSGGPPKAILITSPNPFEGKTTMSVNLAISLALQGRKVVLIDCDLRKPKVHTIFQESLLPGLSNYLTDHHSLEEVIRPTQIDGFSWISAGAIPPNPVYLLHSEAFAQLLQELRNRYDHVVIDTPPILGFADGRDLATLMDAVVLVVKHHSTRRQAGKLASQLLRQINAPLIGVVLNDVEAQKFGYGEYYYDLKDYAKYYNTQDS